MKNVNFVCKESGFLIHSPFEMPLNIPYRSFTKLIYGTSMDVLIKPEVIRSDESMREMDLEHRKCYFDNEYQLKYFKRYTKSHCDLEVLSEITFERCGCVPFNYIRNKSMDVCDISRWPCAIAQKSVVFDGKENTELSRHCLPLCNLIKYESEFIMTRVVSNYSDQ